MNFASGNKNVTILTESSTNFRWKFVMKRMKCNCLRDFICCLLNFREFNLECIQPLNPVKGSSASRPKTRMHKNNRGTIGGWEKKFIQHEQYRFIDNTNRTCQAGLAIAAMPQITPMAPSTQPAISAAQLNMSIAADDQQRRSTQIQNTEVWVGRFVQ